MLYTFVDCVDASRVGGFILVIPMVRHVQTTVNVELMFIAKGFSYDVIICKLPVEGPAWLRHHKSSTTIRQIARLWRSVPGGGRGIANGWSERQSLVYVVRTYYEILISLFRREKNTAGCLSIRTRTRNRK
jgi:hypothetical protein